MKVNDADFIKLINKVDVRGNSPLHDAAYLGKDDFVRLLLTVKGIKIDARNNEGETPLYLAAVHDRVKVLKMFIANNADPCIATHKGETPLEGTKRYPQSRTSKILLGNVKVLNCMLSK